MRLQIYRFKVYSNSVFLTRSSNVVILRQKIGKFYDKTLRHIALNSMLHSGQKRAINRNKQFFTQFLITNISMKLIFAGPFVVQPKHQNF